MRPFGSTETSTDKRRKFNEGEDGVDGLREEQWRRERIG